MLSVNFLSTCGQSRRRRSMLSGTVFQTALFSSVIIPRLRPGLLSLRSVLSSRQQNNKTTRQQNNQTTKQPDNKTTRQQNNQITILYKRYGNANAKSYTIEPYCIKLHKQRWYVLGHFHYTEGELNPAEILWRVLKCKWFRPVDYTTTDSLSYATDSALAAVGNILKVNYSL